MVIIANLNSRSVFRIVEQRGREQRLLDQAVRGRGMRRRVSRGRAACARARVCAVAGAPARLQRAETLAASQHEGLTFIQ